MLLQILDELISNVCIHIHYQNVIFREVFLLHCLDGFDDFCLEKPLYGSLTDGLRRSLLRLHT
jgi:hypothetical protein